MRTKTVFSSDRHNFDGNLKRLVIRWGRKQVKKKRESLLLRPAGLRNDVSCNMTSFSSLWAELTKGVLYIHLFIAVRVKSSVISNLILNFTMIEIRHALLRKPECPKRIFACSWRSSNNVESIPCLLLYGVLFHGAAKGIIYAICYY